ncbi:MAG: hypothetical protein JWM82_1527 [Myxococcales bacterium]|nr:hypothetical protein [Myxococcales bacterium]
MALLVAMLVGTPAIAAPCPVPAGASTALGDVPASTRLAWIDDHLSHTARRARQWTWGWGVGIVVATAGNLVPLAFVPREQRIDWYVGAATTIVGIVPLVIAPLDVVDDAHGLRAAIAARGSGPSDVCPLLADAEARLARDAANQSDGQRWWLHVGNVALNSGVGLFLGLGYHHWGAGVFNAVFGSAVGEAIILTQPTSSIDDARVYRAGALGGAPSKTGPTLSFAVPF